MGIIAGINFISAIIAKNSYGNLGENVTLKIRQILYGSILRKNIGWFDLRENGISILTSAMAQDTSIINGVSTESLGPQVEGASAAIIGIVIGFYYCW